MWHMGHLMDAVAAGGGVSAVCLAGPPPTPLLLSSTSPGCVATMASGEEDSTNGSASETVGKRR